MRKESFFVCLLVLLLSGCAGNNTLTGAVVGAGIGTAVTLGNPAGAAIGGAAGLVIGAAADTQTKGSSMAVASPSVYYEDVYQYNRPYYPSRYPPPVRPGFAFDYYYYAPYGSYVDIVFVSGSRKYRQNWTHGDGRRISHRDIASFRQHRHASFSQQRHATERTFSRQRPLRTYSHQINRNAHQHSRTDTRQKNSANTSSETNVKRECTENFSGNLPR